MAARFSDLLDVARQRARTASCRERLNSSTSSSSDHAVDTARGEHARLAAGGPDLGLEPLEVLAGIGRVRQGVDRLLQRDGADLLQPAPGRDPEVRRLRRELVDEDAASAGAL